MIAATLPALHITSKEIAEDYCVGPSPAYVETLTPNVMTFGWDARG
jgi:hypothetical protein